MAGPLEVFSIANRYLPAADHYQILTIGTEPGPLRASNGVSVQTDLLLEQAQAAYDLLLLVPGGPGAYNECHPALLPWLRVAAPRARRFGSICTGAFVLGHAGLAGRAPRDHPLALHRAVDQGVSQRHRRDRSHPIAGCPPDHLWWRHCRYRPGPVGRGPGPWQASSWMWPRCCWW